MDLAASAGLILDGWQVDDLCDAMGERDDGKWSALEVARIVSRQNGKGAELEALALCHLYLLETELILWSAHEFKTASEGFLRVKALVDNTDDLRRRVRRMVTSHGEEGIVLNDGSRLRFVARSRGSGRGFSGDLVILDEAYALHPSHMAALLPTLSARPNPQIWYTSSAPMETSDVLRGLMRRGRAGSSSRLCYLEHSAEYRAASDDRAAWAQANPALGIRLSEEFIAAELDALGEDEFRRERLGIVNISDAEFAAIPGETWTGLADPSSRAEDPVAFAVDVARDRSWSAIAVYGRRADGRGHGELLANDYRPGTDWVVPRMAELTAKWSPCAWMLDPGGSAGALIKALDEARIRTRCSCHEGDQGVHLVSGREKAQACGALYDACVNDMFRHLNQPHLNVAVSRAATRPADDAWVWSRKDSPVDISPLWAVTLAKFGFDAHGTTAAGGLRFAVA